ncbi:MAG: hypothetical protein JW754_04140 [Candidatus Aenigmarchaeota archaeon]|nr:hypothetical protein [Candidatus Aenigmarchaeota archaeon]
MPSTWNRYYGEGDPSSILQRYGNGTVSQRKAFIDVDNTIVDGITELTLMDFLLENGLFRTDVYETLQVDKKNINQEK